MAFKLLVVAAVLLSAAMPSLGLGCVGCPSGSFTSCTIDQNQHGAHSAASGHISFKLGNNNVTGILQVRNVKQMTTATLNYGTPQHDGGVAVVLWPQGTSHATAQPISVGNCNIEVPFIITPRTVQYNAHLGVKNFKAFVQALLGQKIFAGIHTTSFPNGEKAGQVTTVLA